MKTIHASALLVLLTILTLAQSVQAQSRRKWRPQVKGTAIGAGIGGAAGAIINKRNRLVGGLIGGAVGGAAGYAIGKHKDNKNKQEAARIAAANQAMAEQRAREEAANAAAERERIAAREKPKHGLGVASTVPAAIAVAAPATLASSTDVIPASFLLNPTYGQADTPYASSQYLRRSW
jgi:hypothetical protein